MPLSKLSVKPALSQSQTGLRLEFEAIGTQWRISADDCSAAVSQTKLKRAVAQRIERFDKHYSRFRKDSLVSRMANTAGSYHLPQDAKLLLDTYQDCYELSGGLMTPLIGQLLSDAGYDADYSLQPKPLQQTPSWEKTLDYHFPKLTLKQPALLDFGAIGKGYLVDIIANLLSEAGVTSFCINAGGDILARQQNYQPYRVALEHPENSLEAVGVVELTNQSICASAGNRRAWAGFSHIMNPKTQQSADFQRAIWVVAEHARIADALTTALYFVDPELLADKYDFQYAILHNDHSLQYSAGFPAEFFTEERN